MQGQSGVEGQSMPQGAFGAAAGEVHGGVRSGVAVAGQVERCEQAEGVAEATVGEVVVDTAALGGGGDQAAVAQAGEVVGAGGAEGVGEVGRGRRVRRGARPGCAAG